MIERPTVVVAMSGGVDSSVAAALLVSQGYRVIGMMLRLWSEDGAEAFNRCCTPEALGLARQVASHLAIPFYVVDIRQKFRDTVVQYFLDGYVQGVTPNPCLVCNREIRWGALLQHALHMGASYMATGHYARVSRVGPQEYQLLRAVDSQKDQSYVLSVLDQSQLAHALFPLGELTKPHVRALATEYGLPVAERKDSQDLCFVTSGNYREFLLKYAPQVQQPGPIKNPQGDLLGEHPGLAFFTIGQRKGLGVSAEQPYYVLAKDPSSHTLVIGTKRELGQHALRAREVNWISGSPRKEKFRASVQIRYRAREVMASIVPLNSDAVEIKFDKHLRDITPGQLAVFYDGEICLGGGVIDTAMDALSGGRPAATWDRSDVPGD